MFSIQQGSIYSVDITSAMKQIQQNEFFKKWGEALIKTVREGEVSEVKFLLQDIRDTRLDVVMQSIKNPSINRHSTFLYNIITSLSMEHLLKYKDTRKGFLDVITTTFYYGKKNVRDFLCHYYDGLNTTLKKLLGTDWIEFPYLYFGKHFLLNTNQNNIHHFAQNILEKNALMPRIEYILGCSLYKTLGDSFVMLGKSKNKNQIECFLDANKETILSIIYKANEAFHCDPKSVQDVFVKIIEERLFSYQSSTHVVELEFRFNGRVAHLDIINAAICAKEDEMMLYLIEKKISLNKELQKIFKNQWVRIPSLKKYKFDPDIFDPLHPLMISLFLGSDMAFDTFLGYSHLSISTEEKKTEILSLALTAYNNNAHFKTKLMILLNYHLFPDINTIHNALETLYSKDNSSNIEGDEAPTFTNIVWSYLKEAVNDISGKDECREKIGSYQFLCPESHGKDLEKLLKKKRGAKNVSDPSPWTQKELLNKEKRSLSTPSLL